VALLALLAVVFAAMTIATAMLEAAEIGGANPGFVGPGVVGPGISVAGIPDRYLALYLAAARRYRLDWAVLAGIGEVECDHGRDPDPSCGKEGAVNSAGAGGPAQFLQATWRLYGVDADGDGRADRWSPPDAIFAMANYLRASGAPDDYRRAIFAYNHARWYVAEVERWASLYRARAALAARASRASPAVGSATASEGALGSSGPLDPGQARFTAAARASLSTGDGHVALVPEQAPAAVQAMVIAGNELQVLPYGAAGHPDPRGATSEDCSSSVNYVLYRAGVRSIAEIVHENPLAQDYMSWGDPGPGRWVTIYATNAPSDHVFIVIAGLRLDTSHHGTDVGPNRYEDGPRWRILDHVPTWAHWAVRHPPGL
jgi:hypothetical protein